MDIEQARSNMVEQQARTWEVLDGRVLDLLGVVRRERYVAEEHRRLAFADMRIPLGGGRFMMEPKLEARILQALAVGPDDRALEIGTGSGYLTACLSRLAKFVVSYEIDAGLHAQAAARLAADGYDNIELRTGDAMAESFTDALAADKHAAFDVIVLTASLPVMDRRFHKPLKIGGRLFLVTGEAPAMEALLITRHGRDDWIQESMFETVLEPMAGAEAPSRFSLSAAG